MQFKLSVLVVAVAAVLSAPAYATGACPIKDAGSKAEWRPMDQLEKKLVDSGWKVRRIKVDDQCYEVYGFDDKGQRVEAYFHPKTFEPARP